MNDRPTIYELIPRVMADIGAVSKDQKNAQQGYKFRGIEDFYQAAHPAMVKHGIFCAPAVLDREAYRFEKTNDQGRTTTWLHVALRVDHRFYGPDGSCVSVITCGEGLDNSDKATNKAMSGAMKYALIELFCVPTKDVEDADRDSPETGVKRVSTVARTTEDSPQPDLILPPASDLIDQDQVGRLNKRFRDTLPDTLKPQAEALLHDFLGRRLILDKDGNPSARAIRKVDYSYVGKAAIAWAKEMINA